MYRHYLLIVLSMMMLLSTGCAWESLTLSPPTVVSTPIELKVATATQNKASSTPLSSPPVRSSTEVVEPAEPQAIVVSSKASTEQLVLGQMLLLTLQEMGYEVVDKTGLEETSEVREALIEGEVDIYWEYVGKALEEIHQQEAEGEGVEASLAQVRALDEPQGLIWFEPASFNNSHALLILPSNAEQGITTLDDLANFMNSSQAALTICISADFLFEADGLDGVQEHYGFEFEEQNILLMEPSQIYEQMREGKCDVAEGRATDGRIAVWQLYPLADTEGFFPTYNPAPVIRDSVLAQYPILADQLAGWMDELGPQLDHATMSLLNACVDIGPDSRPYSGDEASPEEVARAFLDGNLERCLPNRIIVSSHNIAPESVWIGKMYVLLLEELGYDVEDKTALGSPNLMREAMLANDIDLYMEAVSFGLMLFHAIPPEAFPAEPTRAWKLAKSLDLPENIIWLERAENIKFSSMLVVRNDTYEQGIQSISDLAEWMNANDAPFKICSNASVAQRPDGIPGIESFYGFKFNTKNIIITDNLADESYRNLRDGECDVSHGLTTDNLEPWGFKALADTENFFPPFTPAPVVRQAILDEYPELPERLRGVTAYLSDRAINELNRLLEVGRDGIPDSGDEESLETIARLALCDGGLIDNCPDLSALGFSITEDVEPEPESEPEPEPEVEVEVEVEEVVEATPTTEATPTPKATPTPSPPAQPTCKEIVLNGSFEEDNGWYLPATTRTATYNSDIAHSGIRSLLLGTMSEPDNFVSHSVGRQKLTIPADVMTATLSYWYYPISDDVNSNDVQGGLIYNEGLSFIRRKLQGEKSNEQAWILQNHDLSALIGDTFHLYFYVSTDKDSLPTAMYLDEVSLQVCYPPEE